MQEEDNIPKRGRPPKIRKASKSPIQRGGSDSEHGDEEAIT